MFYFKDLPSIIKFRLSRITDALIAPKPSYPPHNLPEVITVKWEYDKKNRSYYAEVLNLPGLYTTSHSAEKLVKNINSLIYNYYNIDNHTALLDMERKGLRYIPPLDEMIKMGQLGSPITTKIKRLAYN